MMHDDFDDLFGDATRSYNAPPTTPRDAMWTSIAHARAGASVTPIVAAPSARRSQRWIASAAGIAAVLVAGIAIGRATREPAPASTLAARSDTARSLRAPLPDTESAALDPLEPAASAETGPAPSTRVRLSERAGSAPSRRVAVRGNGAQAPEMSGADIAYRLSVAEHLTRTEVLLTGFRAQARTSADAKMDAQFATLSRDLLSTTRILLSRRSDDPTLTRLLQDLELVLMQLSQYATGGRREDFDAVNQSIEKRNVLPKLRSSIPAGTALLSGT